MEEEERRWRAGDEQQQKLAGEHQPDWKEKEPKEAQTDRRKMVTDPKNIPNIFHHHSRIQNQSNDPPMSGRTSSRNTCSTMF